MPPHAPARVLSVYLEDRKQIEYDRNRPLPGAERRFLDQMDLDMDRGLRLGEQDVASPDEAQRAQYVAHQLVFAIGAEDDRLIAATCAYLSNRFPELLTIRANRHGDDVTINFVFDE